MGVSVAAIAPCQAVAGGKSKGRHGGKSKGLAGGSPGKVTGSGGSGSAEARSGAG